MLVTTPEDIAGAQAAADLVVEIHRRLVDFLKVGQTLAQIDGFVGEALRDLGTKSAFLNYQTARYPRYPSFACLSPNDVVVHGTAGMTLEPLKRGDLISIDIGVIHQGWIGDAAWTYVFEEATDEVTRLCECGIEALRRGIPELRPGAPLKNWAAAVQQWVEKECGYHCVRGLCGHGYGRKLHTPPSVANSLPRYPGEWQEMNLEIEPGLLIAVEPMVAIGTADLLQEPRKWPIRTADGSLAVHYEHDILVMPDGPRVLTEGLYDLPMIVG